MDGARIALWGTSLGGGHAVIVAAEDGRVRAVVAQVPLVDSRVEGEATFYGAGWAAKLLLSAWRDLGRSWRGAAPFEVPAIARAGSFGMIVDDAAFAAFERLVGPRLHVSERGGRALGAHLRRVQPRGAGRCDSTFRCSSWPLARIASRPTPPSRPSQPHIGMRASPPSAGDHFDVYSPPVQGHAAELAAAFLVEQLAP